MNKTRESQLRASKKYLHNQAIITIRTSKSLRRILDAHLKELSVLPSQRESRNSFITRAIVELLKKENCQYL